MPQRSTRSRAGSARAQVWGIPLLLAAGLGASACSPAPERVVLVTIDTLRADRVGCYGHERARTPTLDALAAGGVRFETALSPAPLTLPSHASLFTALDPPRHGVRHNSVFRLTEELPTLAERLGASGFATAAFVGAFVLDAQFGLARGFDVYDDDVGSRPSSPGAVAFSERRADEVVDAALAWLATAPERFFVWVHLYDPHAAYDPPPGFAAAFAWSPYDGEIAFADAQVGRLLEAVSGRWDDERTLFVVTSDHGEALGEHGEPTHSYTLYDATQRIPLLMRGPGLPRGAVVDAPVRLVDVAPTVLARVGAPALAGVDGRDLLPLARGRAGEGRAAYMETLATQLDLGWSPLLGLRTARHKYIRAPRPELYDLASDPREQTNRAEQEPELVARLDAALDALLATARPARPNYEPEAEERERLERLGYVVAGAAPATRLGEVGGVDPKDGRDSLRAVYEANRLLAEGRAAEAFERAAAQPGPNLLLRVVEADAALAAGRLEEAERAARQVTALQPAHHVGHHLLGEVLLAQGRLDEAAAALEEALRRNPRESGALAALGRLAEAQADPERAARSYERALAQGVGRGVAEARWRLAALHLDAGQVDEADALLAGLPAELLERADVALRLASAERRAGLGARALARLYPAIQRHPGLAPLHGARAGLLEDAGRLEEALAERERAYALAPEDRAIWNDLAWTLARLGRDLDRAHDLARRAAAAGREPAVLDTLALVHLRRGEPGRALETVERALPEASGQVRAHLLYLRAAALRAEGRRAAALEAVRECLAELAGRSPPWIAELRALSEDLET